MQRTLIAQHLSCYNPPHDRHLRHDGHTHHRLSNPGIIGLDQGAPEQGAGALVAGFDDAELPAGEIGTDRSAVVGARLDGQESDLAEGYGRG